MVIPSRRSTQSSSPRLIRSLSAPETWGFGLTGHLVWPSVAPAIHAALGPQAIFVWFPAMLVGMFTIYQVKQLGIHWIDVAGGTPNYTAKLLKRYPGIARYTALGYFFSWVSTLPISAIVLTDLIRVNLEAMHLPCPELLLKLGFTLITFVLAFSGTRALSILHLFFVIPAIVLLLAFCVQGIGWLALSPDSPGFFPTDWSHLSFIEWAKWYFFVSYAIYACETASAYVADSRRPQQTLGFLSFSAWLMPPIYLGGSWVLTRLAIDPNANGDPFLSILSAAQPFWGSSALLIVTFLIAAVSLLSCATVVSNCPRILYQLALDGHLSPVFAVVSKRGVFGPGLVLILVFSLLCLVWGDAAEIVAVSSVGWFTSFMGLRLGLWLQRDRPEVLFPRLSLGILLVEVPILLVGGISWGWQEFLIGFVFPIGILTVDAVIRRVPFAPLHPAWWIRWERAHTSKRIKDSILLQVGVLIVLLCAALMTGWSFHSLLNAGSVERGNALIVVLLQVVAFVGVAIACWTSLPQVVALGEARDAAEHLFNMAQDAIVVVDEMGMIQRINPAAESLFKLDRTDLVRRHLNQLLPDLAVHPQDWLNRSEYTLTSVNQSHPITVEVSISDRSHLDFHEYVVIVRDISDRKQAETKMRDSYNLLDAVINGTSDLIFVKSLLGQHILINSAYIEVVGKSAQEVIGQTDLAIFPPDLAREVMAFDQSIMVSGIPRTFEECVPIQGQMRTFLTTKTPLRDALGNAIGLVGITRDINDSKQAEAALAASERRFRTIAATIPGAIFQFSNRDGVWTVDYMSDRCYDIFGVTAAEIMQDINSFIACQHPDDRDSYIQSVIEAVENSTPWHYEGRSIKPDGEICWWQGDSIPTRNEHDEMVFCGVAIDITDRRAAEAALRQSETQLREKAQQVEQALRNLQTTQTQLVQTEKMSSLGQLVAGVAHEINNPVNFIYGNLQYTGEYIQSLLHLIELYQQHYPTPTREIQAEAEAIDLDFLKEDLPKLLSSMKVGADRIKKIVLALRNFSRMDEAEVKPVDIHEGIDSTLMILQNRLKEMPKHPGITVIKEYGDLPLVECYAGQLNQVFMNILSNAVDALEEGGSYEKVSTKEELHPLATIWICTEAIDGNFVRVRIADNGVGMSELVQSRLFDPFFTTKPIGKGTGLGMSISYQIVTEKHGGSLQCNSTLGQGAEFLIEIPIRRNVISSPDE